MEQKKSSNPPVGVIGTGAFGTAIANLIAENSPVLLYGINQQTVEHINTNRSNKNQHIHDNVTATYSLKEIGEQCQLIFPMVASSYFRKTMQMLSPHLTPAHILIHGTKGFDIPSKDENEAYTLDEIKRMSQVIQEETSVVRIGCLSGPNLHLEIANFQPAATVIASRFNQVFEQGTEVLKSNRFRLYSSNDIMGIELAGIFKNYITLATGICYGIGFGENAKALLMTRGLSEMVRIGKAMGSEPKSFMGLAGIGDLIASCSSVKSVNFTLGTQLAKGQKLSDIQSEIIEPLESIKTIKTVHHICQELRVRAPIAQGLYKILFEDLSIKTGIEILMRFSTFEDVDFI